MPKSTKSKPGAAPDPLNLPALKKRYDELVAENGSMVREAALHFESAMKGYNHSEERALRDLLAVKGVLPREEEPPYWKEWNEKLREQNTKLEAELKDLRAKLAEHEGKEQRLDLVRRLVRLDDHNVRLTRAALDCIEGNTGCQTPAEQFVSEILSSYVHGPLTPENAKRDLDEFRGTYNSMVAETKAFLAAYPEIANQTSDAA